MPINRRIHVPRQLMWDFIGHDSGREPTIVPGLKTPTLVKANSTMMQHFAHSVWTKGIWDTFVNHKVYPSFSLFEYYKSLPNSNEICDLITTEQRKTLSKLSGREFELFIASVLREFGIEIEMNVMVMGGEIDLLLCKNSTDHKIYYIIECKNRAVSGKPVEIKQVHRLYGLQEVLKLTNHNIKGSVIVSTTGFTRTAKMNIQTDLLNVSLTDIEGLLEWIRYHELIASKNSEPLLYTTALDSANRFILPKQFQQRYKLGNELTFVCKEDCVEIWNRCEYNSFNNS